MAQENAGRLVLIADDDALVRGLLKQLVWTMVGVEPLVATTATEALKLALNHPVALVITDMNMPGETGAWFLRQLRANGCNVPLIMHSGSLDPADEPRILAMGAARIIQKPSSPSVLRTAVAELLGLLPDAGRA